MATPVFCMTCNRSGYLMEAEPEFCPVCSSVVIPRSAHHEDGAADQVEHFVGHASQEHSTNV
jgi:hypothetical protein